ncbi:GerAB/ArcD/ProY family transporter [Cohnella abietis]|uniref:Germination protein n=1 Tax=Cohnella abietis TaxID=2507935 RepID=A0A3T1D8U8_9BACL|nr:endospore germination permease [Cohnella abietis]BBI34503.1 hypothetical protein KCTCHS21_39020 [Cohnella abietis]
MDKSRITSWQLGMLMYQLILGSSILLMPAITTKLSGHDMWLTPIVGSIVGFAMVWLCLRLHRYFPHATFPQMAVKLLGKVPGKIMGFIFVLFNLHVLAVGVRDYGEFVIGNFFFKTPLLMIIGSMLLLCAFAVRGGVDVLTRSGQIFIPFIFLFTVLTLVFLIPDLKPAQILPMFEKGIVPTLKGSTIVSGWFCQLIAMIYFLPYVKDKKNAGKWGYLTVIGITLTMFCVNIATLMLFGDSTAFYNYPVFMAARYIQLADFFEHVEAIVMMIWVLGAYVKISVGFYITVITTTEWIGIKDYKSSVFPLGLLILVMSIWIAPNFQAMAGFVATSGTFYILTGFAVVPFLMLAVARMRLGALQKK